MKRTTNVTGAPGQRALAFAILMTLVASPWAQPSTSTAEQAPTNPLEAIAATALAADPVHEQLMLHVRNRQLNPVRAARLFAAVRVAQAEAVRSSPGLPSASVAEISAAQTLTWMLPLEDDAKWTAPMLARVDRLGPLKPDEIEKVRASTVAVLSKVLDDNADARRRPLIKPAERPGIWARTPPLFAEQPTEPQGSTWKPWCPGSSQAVVKPAVQPGSAQWTAEVQQVVEVGARLTPAQKAIAHAWHLDAGSITPPGVWNAIAVSHLVDEATPTPLPSQLRALAVLNMAMQDALVAAWRVKLQYWSERPITAVRRELDPSFEPLLVTPPFPGHVSGHAAVSAAAAGVLSHFFPERSKHWRQLSEQAAMSRLYGGIHFASDNEEGLVLGAEVARLCLAAFEAPDLSTPRPLVTSPAHTSADFFVLPHIDAVRE